MVDDVQAIYAVLLAKGYQDQFFSDLGGTRKKEKGGRETLVTCPFCHKEKHFSYNRDKPVWRCWHCAEEGDWIAYLKKAKGLDFKDAVVALAAAAGVNVSGYDQARYREYTQKAAILESAQDFFVQTLNGDSGIRDKVDHHYTRLVGFAVLTSLFAAASEISQNQNRSLLNYPSPEQVAGSAVGQQASDLGAQITRRNLNVQPTIKIPVGYRFNVRVNRDILFDAPYAPVTAPH